MGRLGREVWLAGLAALFAVAGCSAPREGAQPTQATAGAESPPPPPPPSPPPPPPPPLPSPPPPPVAANGGDAKTSPPRDGAGPADPCANPAAAIRDGRRLFPLPPPRPSSWIVVPPSLFRDLGPRPTLGGIDARLAAGLERAGYPPRSYFEVCGGFAVVTRVERIRQDGAPFPADRRFVPMAGAYSTVEDFTIADIIRALAQVQPGRFRVIVLLVTDRPVGFTETRPTARDAERWTGGGTTALPPEVAARPAPRAPNVTGLVYEFRKLRGAAEFVPDGQPAAEQFRRSNIPLAP